MCLNILLFVLIDPGLVRTLKMPRTIMKAGLSRDIKMQGKNI